MSSSITQNISAPNSPFRGQGGEAVPVIAIFDIGKTNKKCFLLNEQYKIVLERSVQFAEIKDEDGFPCDDVQQLSAWIQDSIKEIMALAEFEVKAVNFS